jgi:putative transcriptional regulator
MQEKLLVLRKRNNLSQTRLAEYLGISSRQYGLKERGKNEFTLDEMFKLRDLFNCRIEDIFLPRSHQNGDNQLIMKKGEPGE